MFPRAGDGQLVEELEEGGTQLLKEFSRPAFVGLLFRPDGEHPLRGGEGFLEAADADGFREGVVFVFGEEVELVAEVLEVVVDRRGGEQEDFGADAGFDDVVHEALIATLADDVAVLVLLAGRVVPEVVRLVDDDEVVVAPVQGREIDVARVTGLAAEVGVGNDIVAEAVGDEGIEEAVGFVNRPVVAGFFGYYLLARKKITRQDLAS